MKTEHICTHFEISCIPNGRFLLKLDLMFKLEHTYAHGVKKNHSFEMEGCLKYQCLACPHMITEIECGGTLATFYIVDVTALATALK